MDTLAYYAMLKTLQYQSETEFMTGKVTEKHFQTRTILKPARIEKIILNV